MQIINVTTVYRDANRVQKWVDYKLEDGSHGNMYIKDFVNEVQNQKYIQGNFTVLKNGKIRGRCCKLKYVEVMTTLQIKGRYPGYWIALKPFFLHPRNAREDCGIVQKVMTGDEYDAFCMECHADGTEEDYYFFHTSPCRGVFPLG